MYTNSPGVSNPMDRVGMPITEHPAWRGAGSQQLRSCSILAVTSELVSEMPISLVTGKNTGNSAPITTRALINASRSNVLRPKFPDEETGKFSRAEQRIDLPHQGKLLRDQGKKQPTVER